MYVYARPIIISKWVISELHQEIPRRRHIRSEVEIRPSLCRNLSATSDLNFPTFWEFRGVCVCVCVHRETEALLCASKWQETHKMPLAGS